MDIWRQMAILMAMSSYSVAEAKNNLPKLLDRMLAGEAVTITRRGVPVASVLGGGYGADRMAVARRHAATMLTLAELLAAPAS